MIVELETKLVEIYHRESRSFLQYVDQASPYAGTADRPVLDRVRQLARTEASELSQFADYLESNHIPLLGAGAFPMSFTNYNFVAVRKLLPELVRDESNGIRALERDAASMPSGQEREWIERLAAAKRIHVGELEKLAQ